MYKDGWWAASRPDRKPWDLSPKTLARFGPESDWDPDRDIGWELYNLPEDFSQAKDVAAEHPEKVQELQELWWSEAERNRVLPLMAGVSVMYGILPPLPTQTRFTSPVTCENIQRGMVPRIYGRSYAIEARPGRARGRRRGRHRRQRGLHRRVLPVGRPEGCCTTPTRCWASRSTGRRRRAAAHR